jgi:hypothetical protein
MCRFVRQLDHPVYEFGFGDAELDEDVVFWRSTVGSPPAR